MLPIKWIGIAPDDPGRRVGGAIVDNDQFDIGMALLQHAFYGRADKALVIVGRDDDGNQGALHGCCTSGANRRVLPSGGQRAVQYRPARATVRQ